MQRRHFLASLTALSATYAASPTLATPPTPAVNDRRKRVLRAAHLTDTHVLPTPELRAAEGLTTALRHAQAHQPEVILFGGDCIMDALHREKDEVLAQWDVWHRVLSAELKTPHRACLGNHDIWGWAFRDRPALAAEPGYGKALGLEQLALPERYYSYNQAGWHFIVLDSMQPTAAGKHAYTAALDPAQFAWLAQDLAATPTSTPVCILSHIPIFSACVFFDGDNETTGSWVVPGAWMHADARRLKDLFRHHTNVKVCLSGHIHLAEDITYLGVRYLCHGAVCGGWWKGPYQEFGPAYALIDFYDDGTVEPQLLAYT